MQKATIYLDTNVISTLHYAGSDINAMARRMATRDWWESERRQFELFASIITEQELAEGRYRNQHHCLRFVKRMKYLPTNAGFRELTIELVEEHVVPDNKPGDAAQLAIAIVHKIDYLLTWNYAHLANPLTQARGEKLVARRGLRMPWIVSPESIPRATLGQSTRRPKNE